MTTISEWLLGLLASGVLGYVSSRIFDYFEPKWVWLQTLDKVGKVTMTLLVCVVLVAGSFAAVVGMRGVATPATWRDWLDVVFGYSLIAFTGSQVTHYAVKRRAA